MRTTVGSLLGAALAVACCAGLPLLVGALGGVVLGTLVGLGASTLAVTLLVVALSVWRRQRGQPSKPAVGYEAE